MQKTKRLDIAILSDSKTEYHYTLTKEAIKSLFDSVVDITINVFVAEKQPGVSFEGCTMVRQDSIGSEFNYNKFMNYLASLGTGEYIAFCNNDLIFEHGWGEKIIEGMEKEGLQSASPFCRTTHGLNRMHPTGAIRKGFTVRLEFAGWCFVMKRDAYKAMGGLDEDFGFWCADNSVVEQLKANGYTHGLVTNSVVNHIGGQTLNTISPIEKEQMTFVQVKKFNKKYHQNVWGMEE